MIGDKEKSQVDMYDVFGYLVPGFILLASLTISISLLHNQISITPLYEGIKSATASIFIAIAVLILALSYMTGHIIATIAEMIFERIFVEEIFGYPYQKLILGASKRNKSPAANFYRVIISLFIVAGFTITALPYLSKEIATTWTHCVLKFGIFLIVFRWLERLISHQFRFKPRFFTPAFKYLSTPSRTKLLKQIRYWFFNVPLAILSAPFQLAEGFIRNLLRLDNPLPKETQNIFKKCFEAEFSIDIDTSKVGTDIYWLTYWKITEDSPHLRDRLYKFLSLYGMTRNTSAALFVSAMTFAVPNYFLETPNMHLAIISVTLYAASGIMSLRYYYLYYNYYSKSIFRAFVSLKADKLRAPATS